MVPILKICMNAYICTQSQAYVHASRQNFNECLECSHPPTIYKELKKMKNLVEKDTSK